MWLSLRERKTTPDMREQRLPLQVLSNLLWAAFGVNREDGPMGRTGRTAPSGLNLQGIEIHVALPEGGYLYEAVSHRLIPVVAQDIRSMTNRRPQAGTAPAILIYVANTDLEVQLPPGVQPPQGHPPGEPLRWRSSPALARLTPGSLARTSISSALRKV